MNTIEQEGVPLDDLMLCWNRAEHGGSVIAVAHPDEGNRGRGYMRSDLACNGNWRTSDEAGKRYWFFRVIGEMVARDGVPFADVKEALRVCPEAHGWLWQGDEP